MSGKVPERSLDKPTTEQSPQAPKSAMTELLDTNLKVIKHRLRSNRLVVKKYEVGTVGKTTVAILYINGMVDKESLQHVTSKIKELSSAIKYAPNKKIVTDSFTPPWGGIFPSVFQSERFDSFCSDLMNGRVGVIVDNNPYGTTYPHLFLENFYGADDYYTDYGRLSVRLFRIIGFMLATYLVACYVALDRFFADDFTNKYLKDIFHSGGFFPEWVQIFILLIVFKNLTDIVFRLNQHLMIFIAIMSANIVGTLAIDAHFFDASTIVIVSLSFVASFQVANRLSALVNLLRWTLLGFSFLWGFWGIGAVTFALILILISLRVSGIPYLSPLIPFRFQDLRDSIFVRGDLKSIVNRSHRLRHK